MGDPTAVNKSVATSTPTGLASFQKDSRTVRWDGRDIRYTILPKDTAKKTNGKATLVFMAGDIHLEEERGATHALMFQNHDLEGLSAEQRETLYKAISQQELESFKEANPEVSKAIDQQFPAEIADKVKTTMAFTFPFLVENAKKNKAEHTARVDFLHEGKKYKIELKKKKDGSMQMICIGGKLAEGGVCTVMKMVGINIPKRLKQQTEGLVEVYYKPLEEEQGLTRTIDDLLSAAKNLNPTQIDPALKESFTEEELKQVTELATALGKISKKIPDAEMNPNVEPILANLSEEKIQALTQKKLSEAEAKTQLRKLLTDIFEAHAKAGHPIEEKKKAQLLDKASNISAVAHDVANTKWIRRQDVARGYQVWQDLSAKGVPHLMQYYGVREKGSMVVGSMAKMYKGDLTKLLKTPPKDVYERLDRLRLVSQIAETVEALHRAGYVIVDFKPGNILWDGQNIYLADLAGIVKEGEPFGESTALYAESGLVEGRDSDHRVDLYSLGLIMYDLVRGSVREFATKFVTDNPAEKNLSTPEIVMRGLHPGDPIDDAIAQLLQPDRSARPEAGAVLAVVNEVIAQGDQAIQDSKMNFLGLLQPREEKTETSEPVAPENPLTNPESTEPHLSAEEQLANDDFKGLFQSEEEQVGETPQDSTEKIADTQAMPPSVGAEKVEKQERILSVEETTASESRLSGFIFIQGKIDARAQLKSESKPSEGTIGQNLRSEQIIRLSKDLENCSILQSGKVMICIDNEGVVFLGEKTDLETLMIHLPPEATEKQKKKIKHAYANKPIWGTTAQANEIKEKAQLYAIQLLKELAKERLEMLKEREEKEKIAVSHNPQKATGPTDLKERIIEEDKVDELRKEDIERRILTSEIEEKGIEEGRRKKRKEKEEEEFLAQESDEKRRAAWKKDDQKRDILKEFNRQEDIKGSVNVPEIDER